MLLKVEVWPAAGGDISLLNDSEPAEAAAV